MLEKNQPAPYFRSLQQDNTLVSLDDYASLKNVVLYFYPKDDTPGCTIEANDFTAMAADFALLDTVVICVSKDSCESHRAFIKKYDLNVELLADESGEICEKYGVWQEVEKEGNAQKDKLKKQKALYFLKKYSNDASNDKAGTSAPDYKDYYWNVNPSRYYAL
jgi:peroxiredoxin